MSDIKITNIYQSKKTAGTDRPMKWRNYVTVSHPTNETEIVLVTTSLTNEIVYEHDLLSTVQNDYND